MREMQRDRDRHDRNAFHGGPGSEMRGVRRAPLPEPYSRDPARRFEYQRGAGFDGGGRARVFHSASRDREKARRADRSRARIYQARTDDLDAVGRRGAAPQARALSAGRSRTGAGRRRREASAANVYPRRADDGAELDGYQAAYQSAHAFGDGREYAGGDRAQLGV